MANYVFVVKKREFSHINLITALLTVKLLGAQLSVQNQSKDSKGVRFHSITFASFVFSVSCDVDVLVVVKHV